MQNPVPVALLVFAHYVFVTFNSNRDRFATRRPNVPQTDFPSAIKITDVKNFARTTRDTKCHAADGGAAVVNRRWPSSPPQPISSTHPRGCIQDPALRIPAVANCESQSPVTPARVYAYVPVCMNAPARTCSSLLSRCH